MLWSAVQRRELKGNASLGVCAFRCVMQAAHPDSSPSLFPRCHLFMPAQNPDSQLFFLSSKGLAGAPTIKS